jgi:hypothetical protein
LDQANSRQEQQELMRRQEEDRRQEEARLQEQAHLRELQQQQEAESQQQTETHSGGVEESKENLSGLTEGSAFAFGSSDNRDPIRDRAMAQREEDEAAARTPRKEFRKVRSDRKKKVMMDRRRQVKGPQQLVRPNQFAGSQADAEMQKTEMDFASSSQSSDAAGNETTTTAEDDFLTGLEEELQDDVNEFNTLTNGG